MSLPPFHLVFPVTDLDATRTFFCELLDCRVGRESEVWIDFDFFGHQITAHRVAPQNGAAIIAPAGENPVDGKQVPIPHFGAVLPWEQWHAIADRLTRAGVVFVIAPHIRFPGQVGEQATMFFRDPSGKPDRAQVVQRPVTPLCAVTGRRFVYFFPTPRFRNARCGPGWLFSRSGAWPAGGTANAGGWLGLDLL